MPEKKKTQGVRFECGCVFWVPYDLKPGETFPFLCSEHGAPVKQTFEGYAEEEKGGRR